MWLANQLCLYSYLLPMNGGSDLEHPSEKLAESLAAGDIFTEDMAQWSLGSIREEPEEQEDVPREVCEMGQLLLICKLIMEFS